MFARATSLASLLLLAGSAAAGPPEIQPRWRPGETVRYEMTRTETREADGKARKVVSRTPVEVEVIEADSDGAVLRWTQGSTVYDDPRQEEPLARALNLIQKTADVDLDLDADGALEGVRNWKELRSTGHRLQDAVMSQMAKAGAPKATLEGVRKETEKVFATKGAIERTFARHAALLLLPFGREYEAGAALPYESEVPNPLGGDEPLPAKGEYALKSANARDGVAVIAFKRSLDPKEAARALRKWLDEEAKRAGKPAPPELPELRIDEATECEFDLRAGLVKSVTQTRTVKDGARTHTETVTLARKSK